MLGERKVLQHETKNHSNIDECFAARREPFIVSDKMAIAAKPSESTFDNPTARQDGKALLALGSENRHQTELKMSDAPVHKWTSMCAIDPDESQFLAESLERPEQQAVTVSVLE